MHRDDKVQLTEKMGRSDWTWLSVSARRPSPALKQGNVRHLIFKLNQRTASACKTISQNIRVLTKKLFAVDVDVLKEVVVILPLRTTLPVQSNERKSVNIRRTDTKERPLVFEAIFLFVCFFQKIPLPQGQRTTKSAASFIWIWRSSSHLSLFTCFWSKHTCLEQKEIWSAPAGSADKQLLSRLWPQNTKKAPLHPVRSLTKFYTYVSLILIIYSYFLEC